MVVGVVLPTAAMRRPGKKITSFIQYRSPNHGMVASTFRVGLSPHLNLTANAFTYMSRGVSPR